MPAHQILVAAGAGLAGALLWASVMTGAVGAFLLTYLAPLPLFAVGLAFGASTAAIASAIGAVVALTLGGIFLAVTFAAVNALPAVLVSRQALLNRLRPDGKVEWYPPGLILVMLGGVAAAAFAIVIVLTSGAPGGLEGAARASLERVFAELRSDIPAENATAMAAVIARYMPGMVAMSWLVMIVINAILAQGVLVRFGYNRRPSPRMADIELPGWMPVAAAIAAAGAFMPGFAGFVGGNLVLIAITLYFFAGLAVVHALAGTWRNRAFWLILVYSFTIVFAWPAVLIAGLGVVETWAGLRQRFMARTPLS